MKRGTSSRRADLRTAFSAALLQWRHSGLSGRNFIAFPKDEVNRLRAISPLETVHRLGGGVWLGWNL